MHAQIRSQNNSVNPCVQIMFNINSRNVVNHNILPDKQKQLNIEIPQVLLPSKIDKPFIQPPKKNINQKINKTTLNKNSFSLLKPHDTTLQQNCKSKKKNSKLNKNNLSTFEVQRSTKNQNFQKNASQGLSIYPLSEEVGLVSGKKLTKSKSKLKSNKQTRQKIIELMIHDYETGKISAQNLKVALASLIQKQTLNQGSFVKIKGKIEKTKTQNLSVYKNSMANSLRNTPKHRPAKCKSQKFYQQSFGGFGIEKTHQLNGQPEILQRVIDRKDFVNKIIIKGINSSLFLSKQFTEADSPKKQGLVHLNCINTSDSVKDLRRDMQKITAKSKVVSNRDDLNEFMSVNSRGNKGTGQKGAVEFNQETKDILAYYLEGLKNSPYQKLISKNSNLQMQKQQINQSPINFLHSKKENKPNKQAQAHNKQEDEFSLEDFYIYQHQCEQQQNHSRFQQQQPIFFSGQSVKSISTNQYKVEQPDFKLNELKLKSSLSSELQNKPQRNAALSAAKKQEVNQKRAKNITQTQIKKLNQVLDVIKHQLNVNPASPKNLNQDQILQQIVSFLQGQKINAQKELKIYNPFEGKTQGRKVSENNEVIEQNQIINSFRKKLKNKNITQLFEDPSQKDLNSKIHYEANQIKLFSSQKSLLSSTSSNHLQKTKISELNLEQIEIGLRQRLHEMELKKQQQISVMTQKFINDRVTAKQFQEEKQIIEKWFEMESQKLKSTKRNLIQEYKKAKQYLQKDEVKYETKLSREKSNKMIKCISEKYLASIKIQTQYNSQVQDKKQSEKSQGLNNQNYLSIQEIQNQLIGRGNGREIDIKLGKNKQSDDLESAFILNEFQDSKELSRNPVAKNSEDLQMLQSEIDGLEQHYTDDQEQEQEDVIQSSVGLIRSEISEFLTRYQRENLVSEEYESGEQTDPNSLQQMLQKSKVNYVDRGIEDDWRQSDNQEQSSIENEKLLEKTVNSNTKQERSLKQFSKDRDTLTNESSQLNIVVNKRSSLTQDELFSPKKIRASEQFSEELLQYNSQDPEDSGSYSFVSLNTQFNQNYLKLKCLNDQDKEDIFEFMFLDLCLEIFLQQKKNNSIMRSIQKHIAFLRRKKKLPKGFKTSLQHCKAYIINLQSYLETNFLVSLKRLQSPIGPSAKQMLKFMRDYDQFSQSDQDLQTVNLVLPIQIYQKFQVQPINKLQLERCYDDNQLEQGRLKFLSSLKHFHNKAMFDSLNQMLDVERNYGIWGKPFPWKKTLSIDRSLGDSQLKQKLQKATQKVVENCSYFCGVLVDKEDSVFGKSSISQDHLQHIREDRMSKMLSNDMLDNEDRWIFYDDQETQILVLVAKSITVKLIAEIVRELQALTQP